MKGSILVVDDDRLVLATVVHGLTQAGYAVLDADNGDDAILLTRDHKPDLALLDVRMEGKSGFDVATYLRDVPRVPFMFLSAFSDAQTRAQAQDLGALDYLVKPLDVAQLVPLVDMAMVRVRAAAAGLIKTDAAAPVTGDKALVQAAAAPSVSAVVSVAMGIVMHRYSLTRLAAMERLQRLAREQGLSLETQAERVVLAVEELARTA
jgi:two-component system, response regulator PdtaR